MVKIKKEKKRKITNMHINVKNHKSAEYEKKD